MIPGLDIQPAVRQTLFLAQNDPCILIPGDRVVSCRGRLRVVVPPLLDGTFTTAPLVFPSCPVINSRTLASFQKLLGRASSCRSTMSPISTVEADSFPRLYRWYSLSSRRYSCLQSLQKWFNTLLRCLTT